MEKFDSFKKMQTYDLPEALQYLSYYLEDYDRFNYTNKIIKLQTDFVTTKLLNYIIDGRKK